MDGDTRRGEIIHILSGNTSPVAGTELAARLGVSRQVIVQDIALLRAVNKNILSTNKGYILFRKDEGSGTCKRTYKVMHDTGRMQEELYLIVDCGGRVLDVVVEHPIYGQIMADLIVNSRQDADNFVKQVAEYGTKPLNALTDGLHYHTVEAREEGTLGLIQEKLQREGFLVP
ncbi:putative transcription repressor NiaR [Lachnospiraceae bacterium]|nr:putative transcription repressor NiaR [Lachnospiraceae bacterium]